MKKDDTVFLRHVLDAIGQVRSYVGGLDCEAFFENRLVQDAVIRQLEVIGEASRNLSEEFRAGQPDVPWGDIVGMRNRLTHAYFDVDLGVVWEVVEQDLPVLEDRLRALLGPGTSPGKSAGTSD
ncbi:MAG: DUF86 domain-containing protein [Deltaproteobacteria bacterium]|nr:DUF86 domain-containing protein [Deltaproteobacteria bacterium]